MNIEFLGGGRRYLYIYCRYFLFKRWRFINMIHYYFICCHVKFNPPIPIRTWEVNLSHFIGFLGDDDIEATLDDDDI